MNIGEIELVPLNDGYCRLPPSFYVGLDWTGHESLLNADGLLEIPIGCFLLRSGDRVVLIDAGMGPYSLPWGTGGGLPAALAEAGAAPSDIDTVVCSHLHIDHIGLLTQDDRPYFPNAVVRFGQADWDHFAAEPDEDRDGILRVLAEDDRLDPISGDNVALAPGLTARHTPGHTPGTTASWCRRATSAPFSWATRSSARSSWTSRTSATFFERSALVARGASVQRMDTLRVTLGGPSRTGRRGCRPGARAAPRAAAA